MSKPDGGQAFPVPETEFNHFYEGMTLRDYFAAKSLPLASIDADGNQMGAWMETSGDIALRAYRMADALLKARNG